MIINSRINLLPWGCQMTNSLDFLQKYQEPPVIEITSYSPYPPEQ